MGSPYNINNAFQTPPNYYPRPSDMNYHYPPSWQHNYQDSQPRPSHYHEQSYHLDRMYRPDQGGFQERAPLGGRVSVPPSPYPSPWCKTPLPYDTFYRPPSQPLPGFDQHYHFDSSQSRGTEIASSYSSPAPSSHQGKGTLSTFLSEKCQSKKIIDDPIEDFVDLATMFRKFEHICHLPKTISHEYIKEIARLRCSETGQSKYNGLTLDYNSGDTLFNIFARGVNEAYDLSFRDQLKRNMELIANLMDSHGSDSPIFQACSKATLDQEEAYSRNKKTFSETGKFSQAPSSANRQKAESRKRKDPLMILDAQDHSTKNNYIQAKQPQPKRPCLKWVDTKFNDEENRPASELNQSEFSKRPPSTQRKKRLGNPEAPPIEKPPEETRRSQQRRRQSTETSQLGAKSIEIDLSNENEEKKIEQKQSKGGISVKILPKGKTATSSSRTLTHLVEPQSEKRKLNGESNSLICQENVEWSPLFVPIESDVSEKSQEAPPVTNFFANSSDSMERESEIKIPTAIRPPLPAIIEIKAPSKSQGPLDAREISSDNFVEKILRQEEGSQRQLPPIKID